MNWIYRIFFLSLVSFASGISAQENVYKMKIHVGEEVFTYDVSSIDSISFTMPVDENACVIVDSDSCVTYSVVESGSYEYINSEFSVDDIVACEIVPGKTYDINTKITAIGSKFCLHEFKGSGCPIIENHVDDWNMSMKKKNGFYHLTFTVPDSFEKNVLVRFYQGMNINFKVLIMRIKK